MNNPIGPLQGQMPMSQGHHLLAWFTTNSAVAGYQAQAGVNDPLVPINANNDFQIFDDYEIAAAYAGGAANVRSRFTSASLSLRGNPQIVPFEGTILAPKTPNFAEWTANPLQLRIGEALHADMESNSATVAAIGAWLIRRGHDFTVPFKDLRWIRFTSTITTVAGKWASGPIVLDDPLEGGDYAVYGMQVFFATSVFARLIFPGQVMRPGCLGQATAVLRSAPMFWGGLGTWGIFNFLALPQLEVIDTASAQVTYTGWLLCSNTQGIGADLQ
jgi:hypothetical protein